MNFKSFFENNRAVSPVIGVVLMVAITFILAAALGSSVFGQGTSAPAPQANLQLRADAAYDGTNAATIIIEHLGGDPINFSSNATTKIMIHVDSKSHEVAAASAPSADILHTNLATMSVGDTKTLKLYNYTVDNTNLTAIEDVTTGSTVNVKIIDVATSQLICDQNVRF